MRKSTADVEAPARPTRQVRGKSAQTRNRILSAAAEVLSRKGYAGTRLTDIAELAEIQAPAIYYYFGSRDELVEEVVRTGQMGARQRVEAALGELPSTTPYLERICVAVEAHLRAVLHLASFTTAAIRNSGQLPAPMRSRIRHEQNQYGALWHELFTAAYENGELDPAIDVHVAQLLVIGALNWTPEWWTAGGVPIDVMVANATTLVRAGLARPLRLPVSRPPNRRRA
jgi:AcrR family transcriptional regulator